MGIFFSCHEQEAYRLELYTSVVHEPKVADQLPIGSSPIYILIMAAFQANNICS